MNTILQDLHFALRQLRRAPAFALVAIATLALAIGVSTAVFSVLDATVVRPLPFNHPESIVALRTWSPQGYGQPASWLQYQDWRAQNTTLSALAGYDTGSANLEAGTDAAPIRTVETTDNFFGVFAVPPILGRTFLQGEDTPGHNDVAVLSYELWQQTFAANPAVIGTTIKVDGSPSIVVGVMPAGFRFPLSVTNALYRPFHLPLGRNSNRGQHFMPTIARLKPGITLQQAQADLNQVFLNIGRAYPEEAGRRVKLTPESEAALGNTAGPLRVLTLSVFGVLLIGCVNIAGLLLARGVRRQRELGLRAAVGAGRARLVRQLLTEASVLSLTGALAGIAVAATLLQLIRQLLVHSLARGADVHLNLTVLAATVATALLTGLAAGALPAIQSARIAPSLALRSGGSAGSSRGQNRLRSTLIATQIAIALSLLVVSGLLLRNLASLRNTSLGFSPQGLFTEQISLTPATYAGRDMQTAFYEPLLTRLRSLPGVEGAGAIQILPIQDYGSNSDVSIVGKPPAPPNQETLAENRILLPGALEAIGARVLRGRALSTQLDRADSAFSVTVNQAFVRKFFTPGEDPVGRQIAWGNKPAINLTIVGVLSDLRQDLNQPPLAEFQIAAAQVPAQYRIESLSHMTLVVRTSGDPAALAPLVRQAMHDVDPTVPFRPPLTMQNVIADQLTFQRLESWLFGIFAALALLLSLVGIYGMVHHEVELRTRDIGVRMALGSTRARVVRGILTRVTTLMALGIAAGWALTLSLQKLLSAVIELKPAQNALLLTAVTLTLALFGIAASLFPARRAASIQPTEALRSE